MEKLFWHYRGNSLGFALFFLIGIAVNCVNATIYAETMTVIEHGKIVAGATAVWNENDSLDIKEKLYRLTMLINQSLRQLTGHNVSYKEFNGFKNKIRIKIAENLRKNLFSLWLISTEDGKELRITGNNIDNTEKAVDYFATKYLHISADKINAIKDFLKKRLWLLNNLREEKIKELPFENLDWPEIDTLTFEQKDMEIVHF